MSKNKTLLIKVKCFLLDIPFYRTGLRTLPVIVSGKFQSSSRTLG